MSFAVLSPVSVFLSLCSACPVYRSEDDLLEYAVMPGDNAMDTRGVSFWRRELREGNSETSTFPWKFSRK